VWSFSTALLCVPSEVFQVYTCDPPLRGFFFLSFTEFEPESSGIAQCSFLYDRLIRVGDVNMLSSNSAVSCSVSFTIKVQA
jgi:hypothetical protein